MYSVLYFMQYNTLITKFLVVMTKEIENINQITILYNINKLIRPYEYQQREK
jgi:hypothetical protein